MNPWQPSGLRRAVESFLEALRLNRNLHFALLLGGPASAPVARALSRTADEPRSDIADLILRALQLKNHTEDTAQLASVLQVVSVDKDAWGLEIVGHLADLSDFGTGAAAVFARVLAAEYLEWSSKRLSITFADVSRVHQQFREENATEQTYQAIGRGLGEGRSEVSVFETFQANFSGWIRTKKCERFPDCAEHLKADAADGVGSVVPSP